MASHEVTSQSELTEPVNAESEQTLGNSASIPMADDGDAINSINSLSITHEKPLQDDENIQDLEQENDVNQIKQHEVLIDQSNANNENNLTDTSQVNVAEINNKAIVPNTKSKRARRNSFRVSHNLEPLDRNAITSAEAKRDLENYEARQQDGMFQTNDDTPYVLNPDSDSPILAKQIMGEEDESELRESMSDDSPVTKTNSKKIEDEEVDFMIGVPNEQRPIWNVVMAANAGEFRNEIKEYEDLMNGENRELQNINALRKTDADGTIIQRKASIKRIEPRLPQFNKKASLLMKNEYDKGLTGKQKTALIDYVVQTSIAMSATPVDIPGVSLLASEHAAFTFEDQNVEHAVREENGKKVIQAGCHSIILPAGGLSEELLSETDGNSDDDEAEGKKRTSNYQVEGGRSYAPQTTLTVKEVDGRSLGILVPLGEVENSPQDDSNFKNNVQAPTAHNASLPIDYNSIESFLQTDSGNSKYPSGISVNQSSQEGNTNAVKSSNSASKLSSQKSNKNINKQMGNFVKCACLEEKEHS